MAYFFRKTGKAAHGCLPHFAPAVPQMRHMSLSEQAPQNPAKPFKRLFLKLLPRHRELMVAGTRRAFNVRCNRAAEVQCQTDLENGLSYFDL